MRDVPRRVVTGHDRNGKSIFVSDGSPPTVLKIGRRGVTFFELWNTESTPVSIAPFVPEPTDRPIRIPPPPKGTIIRIVDFLPGMSQNGESPQPMVHRTETIDYGIVLEGEIFLVLDDSETRLEAGDVVIQRGTSHAWDNRSDRLARMAFILIDGKFSGELKSSLPAGALEHLMHEPLDTTDDT